MTTSQQRLLTRRHTLAQRLARQNERTRTALRKYHRERAKENALVYELNNVRQEIYANEQETQP